MSTETNNHNFVFDIDDLTLLAVNKFKNNSECAIQYFLSLFSKHPSMKSNQKTKEHLNDLIRRIFDEENKPEIFSELLVIVVLMNN